MGLRIRTNVAAIKANRHLENTTKNSETNMEKLSSGYRVNKAADDAAGMAITEKLRAKVTSAEQAKRNTQDGISLIQVAEGSYNEITNVLVRLRELATQAASDTISNTERSYANKEYTELVNEIDRIANSTEFNGRLLLKGPEENDDLEELGIHVGVGDASQPNTDDILVNLKQIQVDAKNVMGLGTDAEIGPIDPEEDAFTREQAAEKITNIDRHLRLVATNRSYLGSKQSRLTSAANNLAVNIENTHSSKSRIKDVDFAVETAKFTQNKILSSSGVSVLSHANSFPDLVLGLLR